MRELAAGLWHWTARHPRIGAEVSSYYLSESGVLIDALIPAEGVDWFEAQGRPRHFLLTNRHHDRGAWQWQDTFGCTVHCISNGLHELQGRGPVEPFEFGDRLPGDAIVHEVDSICPDETALYLPAFRALACADGVIGLGGGGLGFVPDSLMDDPDQTKRGLRDAYRRLTGQLDFEILLLAHGPPIVGGAREALRAFIGG